MYNSRNILKIFGLFVLTSHIVLASRPAEAISLEFVPANQTIDVGNQVTVDVLASDPGGTMIGAFDFFVNYEPGVLTLTNVQFGNGLGGPVDSLQNNIESPAGTVNLSEVCLLAHLTPLQNGVDDVPLFSLVFDADNLGTSALTFSENIAGATDGFLGDENGQAITLDAVGTGSVNVVPIPGAVWLMGSGLLALLGFKSRRIVTALE